MYFARIASRSLGHFTRWLSRRLCLPCFAIGVHDWAVRIPRAATLGGKQRVQGAVDREQPSIAQHDWCNELLRHRHLKTTAIIAVVGTVLDDGSSTLSLYSESFG